LDIVFSDGERANFSGWLREGAVTAGCGRTGVTGEGEGRGLMVVSGW
jgi:hypothetical protein